MILPAVLLHLTDHIEDILPGARQQTVIADRDHECVCVGGNMIINPVALFEALVNERIGPVPSHDVRRLDIEPAADAEVFCSAVGEDIKLLTSEPHDEVVRVLHSYHVITSICERCELSVPDL